MGVRAVKGRLTASTVNGETDAEDLSAVFSAGEPLRAVIFFAARNTADGQRNLGSSAEGGICVGFATNDGGSIQQGYAVSSETDAAGTSDTARGVNTTAALKHYSANATPTVDMEMDVTAFSDTGFTVTWTNAPAEAILVEYLAIGGSDIEAARVFDFVSQTSAGAQDITISSGWGQPDVVMLATASPGALGDQTGSAGIMFGVGVADGNQRATSYFSQDAQGNMVVSQWQGDAILVDLDQTVNNEADLAATSGWPTDGFELSWTINQAALGTCAVIGLALKGDFTAQVGSFAAPTSGSLPVSQTLPGPGSGTAKVLLAWGWPLGSLAGVRTTDADLGGFWMGASDNASEGVQGFTQDDGNTTSILSTHASGTKSVRFHTFGESAVLQSEADAVSGAGGASGDDWQLSWSDIDSVAREGNYLILGEAVVGDPVDGDALDLVWDTRAEVNGNALDLVWDLQGAVDGAARDLLWDTRAAVDGGALDLLWDVRSPVDGAAFDLVWDLEGAGTAVDGDPLELVWDLEAEEAEEEEEEPQAGGIVRKPIERLPSAVSGEPLTLSWRFEPLPKPGEGGLARRLAPPAAEPVPEPEPERTPPRPLTVLPAPGDSFEPVVGEPDPLPEPRWPVRGEPLELSWNVAREVDGRPLRLGWEVRAVPTAEEDERDLLELLVLAS